MLSYPHFIHRPLSIPDPFLRQRILNGERVSDPLPFPDTPLLTVPTAGTVPKVKAIRIQTTFLFSILSNATLHRSPISPRLSPRSILLRWRDKRPDRDRIGQQAVLPKLTMPWPNSLKRLRLPMRGAIICGKESR